MRFVYWNGSLILNYFIVAPVLIFFLTIDRCVTLRFGLNDQNKLRKLLNTLDVFVIFLIYFGSFTFFLLELPIPDERCSL